MERLWIKYNVQGLQVYSAYVCCWLCLSLEFAATPSNSIFQLPIFSDVLEHPKRVIGIYTHSANSHGFISAHVIVRTTLIDYVAGGVMSRHVVCAPVILLSQFSLRSQSNAKWTNGNQSSNGHLQFVLCPCYPWMWKRSRYALRQLQRYTPFACVAMQVLCSSHSTQSPMHTRHHQLNPLSTTEHLTANCRVSAGVGIGNFYSCPRLRHEKFTSFESFGHSLLLPGRHSIRPKCRLPVNSAVRRYPRYPFVHVMPKIRQSNKALLRHTL